MKAWWTLLRPRILAMVLLTMGVAALGTHRDQPIGRAACALGTAALVVAGAMVLNQRIERASDALMPRTASRPLPAGRLGAGRATLFGLGLSLVGLGALALLGDRTLLLLAALGWIAYLLVYTPLKFRSAWQTPVGALAGALPVLLGAAAAGSPFSLGAMLLFGMVFCWQLPHAMAIAWLNRGQFAAAGIRLAGAGDPAGRVRGLLAVGGTLGLVGLWVAMVAGGPGPPGPVALAGGVAGIAGSLAFLACAVAFLRRSSDSAARRLLWASLVYLPAALLVWLISVRA